MTTPKHTFRFLSPAICLAALVALTSCDGSASSILDPLNVDAREEVYKPVVGEPGKFGVVSIHEIIRHKRGAEKELEVETMFEDEIIIDRNPLLDSSDIISI